MFHLNKYVTAWRILQYITLWFSFNRDMKGVGTTEMSVADYLEGCNIEVYGFRTKLKIDNNHNRSKKSQRFTGPRQRKNPLDHCILQNRLPVISWGTLPVQHIQTFASLFTENVLDRKNSFQNVGVQCRHGFVLKSYRIQRAPPTHLCLWIPL